MSQSPSFTALLDANVLYPAPLRDLLLHIAAKGLYRPKWTDRIQQEWVSNLLLNRADLTAAQLAKTVVAMNRAFPDATIQGYEALIGTFRLPDPNDEHVLAAAIRGHAGVIVTANLKDFPLDRLKPFDVQPQHPDEFIADLLGVDPGGVLEAFLAQVANLKNPSKSAGQVLETLRQNGLAQTTQALLAML